MSTDLFLWAFATTVAKETQPQLLIFNGLNLHAAGLEVVWCLKDWNKCEKEEKISFE